MSRNNCINVVLDEICLLFCNHVGECPIEAECYYRLRIRENIEDILDDDSNNGVE